MIGWLQGTIGDRWQEGNRSWLLLICGPVGYELQVSESLWRGTALESQIAVHTHLQQREDGQQLYGFETKADRNLFRLLISVNGVGPQVALGLISGLGAVSLLQAMAAEDVKVLCQAPGVGKRTAERLSLEWRSRLQERWKQQGRFDWSLPDDPIRVDSPFDLLLLPGAKGQSWRLLRPPAAEGVGWRSYPLTRQGLVVDAVDASG